MATRTIDAMGTPWHLLRAELGVDPAHPAYESARIAFDLGAEARTLREQRGWSQVELAKRAGVTDSAIARFEAGGMTAALTVLARIADALQMRLSIVFVPA
ncbi:MAG TPA: helix-turn-helix transcriptional regulator [Pseudonocardiaceae bacterium]|nr:helix-turn-helix transcriptional regulator [Pseudonocardiaceae bacterium]